MSAHASQLHVLWCFIVIIGNICACINAATMALVDAGIPMNDFVSASTAGYIEDTPMLGTSV